MITEFDKLRAEVYEVLNPDHPDHLVVKFLEILDAIKYTHEQKGDDRCWMDITKVYEAAGLPPPDNSVGDQEAMLKNCQRFVLTYCAGGPWKSYAELSQELTNLRAVIDNLPLSTQDDITDAMASLPKREAPK